MRKTGFMLFVYSWGIAAGAIAMASEHCSSVQAGPAISEISSLRNELANAFPCIMLASMKDPPLGSKCLSSSGAWFIRMDDGWMDELGVVWHDGLASDVSWEQAKHYCAKRNLQLPTETQILRSDLKGISDFLPHGERQSAWLWTSEEVNQNLAKIYKTNSGATTAGKYNTKPFFSAKCVSMHR